MSLPDLVLAIQSFNQTLLDLQDGPLSNSEDSEKLEGNTFAELKNEVVLIVDEHTSETGNVHETSASELQTITAPEFNGFISQIPPRGLLPIDYVEEQALSFFSTQTSLTLEDSTEFVWSSDFFEVAPMTLDLNTQFPDAWRDNTFFIYFHITDTQLRTAEVIISINDNLDETDLSYLRVAFLETNDVEITRIEQTSVYRIAGFYIRTSIDQRSIPVSLGYPMDVSSHWLAT